MTEINRSILVPYSTSQMYALINDVQSYSEFLPWCSQADLLEHTDTLMRARLHFKKGIINHSFITRNKLQQDKFIEINLEDGPFQSLDGQWQFTAIDDQSCQISLQLTFSLESPMLTMMMSGLLEEALSTMVDAFSKRAEFIYGE